jgi:hypothetical protein
MHKLDLIHPQYGLAAHKGYGTPAHRRALEEHGPCPLHRRSFAPVTAASNDLGPMLFDAAGPDLDGLNNPAEYALLQQVTEGI